MSHKRILWHRDYDDHHGVRRHRVRRSEMVPRRQQAWLVLASALEWGGIVDGSRSRSKSKSKLEGRKSREGIIEDGRRMG